MKTSSLFTSSLLAFTLSTSLVACQTDNDDLSTEDYDDIAAALSGLLGTSEGGGEVGSMADATAMADAGVLATAEGASSTEIVVRAGLSYEYRVDCFSAEGALLDTCSELTDSAEVSVEWAGELSTPRYESSVQRSGSWSLTGMQGEIAELNGAGSFDINSSFMALYRPVERNLELSYDAVYEGVQVSTADRSVIGGTVRYTIQGVRFVERRGNTRDSNFTVNADVTFDAGVATVVLDRTHRYEVNLNDGTVISSETL